jgi:hypothetical protein
MAKLPVAFVHLNSLAPPDVTARRFERAPSCGDLRILQKRGVIAAASAPGNGEVTIVGDERARATGLPAHDLDVQAF